jgi:hypothetical protein
MKRRQADNAAKRNFFAPDFHSASFSLERSKRQLRSTPAVSCCTVRIFQTGLTACSLNFAADFHPVSRKYQVTLDER